MKQYRFDYIKEMVDKWRPDIPRTVEQIDFTPWYVRLHWIGLDDNGKMTVTPPKDYYEEEIEDLGEWHRQRDEYIRNLAKEYETLQNETR